MANPTSWTPSDGPYQNPSFYDNDKRQLVQPLAQMNLVPSSVNPGGDYTLWMFTDGNLMYGDAPLAAGGAGVATLSLPGLLFTPNTGGGPDIAVDIELRRNGNVATCWIKSNTVAKSACRWYSRLGVLPGSWRPAPLHGANVPFFAVVSTGPTVVDDDIMAYATAEGLLGSIQLHRSGNNNTDWTGASAGWGDIYLTWIIP
jgi:hypothetical protein